MDTSNPTYPTRSLNFLHKLRKNSQCSKFDQAQVSLTIIISGAGLGGLATAIALALRGHKVTIFEQVEKLAEVGAGIQIPPNSSRLLQKFGLEPYFEGKVVEPANIHFRRWETGDIIGKTKLVPDFRKTFDGPYWVIHRAHFHNALLKRALELGVEVKTGCKVVGYDFDGPSITLENGSAHAADLVVAAEGIRSPARTAILGDNDKPPYLPGFAAYRATVDASKILADPEIAWLVQKPSQDCWIGDMRHVMTYTIASGTSFNMVLSHPETSDPSTWNQTTALEDMKAHFQGWDPKLTKIINMIDKTLKWPLVSGVPLQNWVSTSGKALIIGDAAHAMVPYMSEGAAMAVEDGAALSQILSLITHKSDLPYVLRVYEKERIKRTSQMQQASLINGKLWHFADGFEQRARDEGMRPEVMEEKVWESPNQWSDPLTASWAYGYDAEKAIVEAWKKEERASAML